MMNHPIQRLAACCLLALGLLGLRGRPLGSQVDLPSAGSGVAEPASYLKPLVTELLKVWPENRVINVVAHGHSVPAGYFKTPAVHTFESYPHLLHQGLAARFPTATINVIVSAIGGEASTSGAERFRKDVLGHQPDLILIDYALNDRRMGLAKARVAWGRMLEEARGEGIPVLLLTPTADTSAQWNDPSDPLNQHAGQIRALATEWGVGLVDSTGEFQALQEALPEYMSQVNHPNAKGHRLVADKLLEWFPRP